MQIIFLIVLFVKVHRKDKKNMKEEIEQEEETQEEQEEDNTDNTTVLTETEQGLATELREITANERDLNNAGRQHISVKGNMEKFLALKTQMIKKNKGISLKIDDTNKVFGTEITEDLMRDNSKFYAYKNRIFKMSGVWMSKDLIDGYIRFGVK